VRSPGRILVAVAAAALAAGCGTPPAGTVPVAAASPSPSPAHPAHQFGEASEADTGFVAGTVFAYQQPVGAGAPGPGPDRYWWAAVDVQVCAAASSVFDVTVSPAPWSLVYPDTGEVTPAGVRYPQFPQPGYPRARPG